MSFLAQIKDGNRITITRTAMELHSLKEGDFVEVIVKKVEKKHD